jgi:RepB DNA-primase N-terminal domain
VRASEHTELMLRWWARMGLDLADLAVRRPSGQMLWQHALPLERLPLAWARAENARGADIYLRPARHRSWPVVFLDDLDTALGIEVVRRHAALLVQTSREGGCHLWMLSSRPLSESERRDAQRHLAARSGADPASTSGEHLGRLAGLRNWKRSGQWVNVLGSSTTLSPWEPRFLAAPQRPLTPPAPVALPASPALIASGQGLDLSPSGKEWGWVCGAIASGRPVAEVLAVLLEHCRARRGHDAQRYALRTVQQALRHLGLSTSAQT